MSILQRVAKVTRHSLAAIAIIAGNSSFAHASETQGLRASKLNAGSLIAAVALMLGGCLMLTDGFGKRK